MSALVEVKTAELEGKALAWAVARATGALNAHNTLADVLAHSRGWWMDYDPSADWAQGGPLIQRHCVDLEHLGDGRVLARILEYGVVELGAGDLQAACRAIVATRFPDTFMVPAELVGGGV